MFYSEIHTIREPFIPVIPVPALGVAACGLHASQDSEVEYALIAFLILLIEACLAVVYFAIEVKVTAEKIRIGLLPFGFPRIIVRTEDIPSFRILNTSDIDQAVATSGKVPPWKFILKGEHVLWLKTKSGKDAIVGT